MLPRATRRLIRNIPMPHDPNPAEVPLDAPIQDPGNLSSLTFTENTSGLNTIDVILVATVNASSTPEPGALAFMALCGSALLLIPRRGLRR